MGPPFQGTRGQTEPRGSGRGMEVPLSPMPDTHTAGRPPRAETPRPVHRCAGAGRGGARGLRGPGSPAQLEESSWG